MKKKTLLNVYFEFFEKLQFILLIFYNLSILTIGKSCVVHSR